MVVLKLQVMTFKLQLPLIRKHAIWMALLKDHVRQMMDVMVVKCVPGFSTQKMEEPVEAANRHHNADKLQI